MGISAYHLGNRALNTQLPRWANDQPLNWEDTKHNHWSVGGTRWCQAIFLKITPSQPGTPRPSIYKWLGYQLDDEPNLYIRKWLFHHFHPCINGRLGFQEEVPSIKNAHLLFHPFFCLNCGGFYYGLFLLYRNGLIALLPVVFVEVPELQVPLMGALLLILDWPIILPPKTNIRMATQPFEDVSPVKTSDFPLSC